MLTVLTNNSGHECPCSRGGPLEIVNDAAAAAPRAKVDEHVNGHRHTTSDRKSPSKGDRGGEPTADRSPSVSKTETQKGTEPCGSAPPVSLAKRCPESRGQVSQRNVRECTKHPKVCTARQECTKHPKVCTLGAFARAPGVATLEARSRCGGRVLLGECPRAAMGEGLPRHFLPPRSDGGAQTVKARSAAPRP